MSQGQRPRGWARPLRPRPLPSDSRTRTRTRAHTRARAPRAPARTPPPRLPAPPRATHPAGVLLKNVIPGKQGNPASFISLPCATSRCHITRSLPRGLSHPCPCPQPWGHRGHGCPGDTQGFGGAGPIFFQQSPGWESISGDSFWVIGITGWHKGGNLACLEVNNTGVSATKNLGLSLKNLGKTSALELGRRVSLGRS